MKAHDYNTDQEHIDALYRKNGGHLFCFVPLNHPGLFRLILARRRLMPDGLRLHCSGDYVAWGLLDTEHAFRQRTLRKPVEVSTAGMDLDNRRRTVRFRCVFRGVSYISDDMTLTFVEDALASIEGS